MQMWKCGKILTFEGSGYFCNSEIKTKIFKDYIKGTGLQDLRSVATISLKTSKLT